MNAGRLLRSTGYDTPELRAELAPVDPDDINVWPAAPLMRRLWRPGISAVTINKMVFVDPAMISGDRDRLARLVIHELVHVRQFVVSGYLTFMGRYLLQYGTGRIAGKTGRQAYLDIAAEAEARDVAARARKITR